MLIKEFIQLKRDRVSFAMIIMIPLVQLLLFGYAINTNPRHLPTAVLLQEQSDLGRSILKALENTDYFQVTHLVRSEAEFDRLLASGTVLFAVEIPANFERAVRRGDRPALLVAADATDPVASGSAIGALNGTLVQTALRHDRAVPDGATPPFEIRTHARYNPAGNTSLNIVPGLVGTILTMTMLIFTALSVTREIERGTMESLLVDADHAGRDHARQDHPLHHGRLRAGRADHRHRHRAVRRPAARQPAAARALSTLFITTNLAVGYTFSTIAQNQLQAMQMSMMFFLPNILLSGFMFPFAGMPGWAQWIGEFLPLTHYLRIVRAIMLKGATPRRPAFRHAGARRADADRHGDCDHPLPPHAGLEIVAQACQACRRAASRRPVAPSIAMAGNLLRDFGMDARPAIALYPGPAAEHPPPAEGPMSQPATATTDAGGAKLSIGFINWAHALDHYVMLIFPTVVIGLEAIYGRSYAELIALGTASFIAFGVFSLPAGWLADRWSRRNMMALFYAGCGLSLIGAGACAQSDRARDRAHRARACSRRSTIRSAPRC